MRFKYRMQVVAVEDRPARGQYPASSWVLLADGAGEPINFRLGAEGEVVQRPPVFTQIEADLEIVGRTFGVKKTVQYVCHGWTEPKG